MQLRLIRATEISSNYSQKLLVMTDKDKPTKELVNIEYSLDPQNSKIVSADCLQKTSCIPEADSNTVVKIFGQLSADGQTVSGLSGSSLAEKMLDLSRKDVAVFSLDGSTSTELQHHFLQTLMVHGFRAVLEMNQGDRHIFKAINNPDPVSRYDIPQDEMEHTTRYDHQHIILMENEPVVLKAGEYLWLKHPSKSSVYVLDENHQLKLVHGDRVPKTEKSRVSLVGHGSRGNSGEMTISGYNAKSVANIIEQAHRIDDKIKTASLVACELGSEPEFAETVLTELDAANIKIELHLRKAKVQVTSDGRKITQATEEAEWRHKDDTQKVVAVLVHGKVVLGKKSESHGEAVSTGSFNQLKKRDKGSQDQKEKPKQVEPKIFMDQKVMMRVGWDACFELMATMWAFFSPELPLPNKVDIGNEGNLNKKYRIMKFPTDKNSVVWLKTDQEIKAVLSECHEVKPGEDVRNIIKYYADNRQNKYTYLMVNGWILAVDRSSLYVFLIGKKLDNNDNNEVNEIEKHIRAQIGKESYKEMRLNILSGKKTEKYFVQFVKDFLHGKPMKGLSLQYQAWATTYFVASLICESVRNYRTFPLILMAASMTERPDNNDQKFGFDFFFEKHSMANGGTWVDKKTGFEGVTSGPVEKLEKVVQREVNLYNSWKKDRDPKKNPEKILDIFPTNNVNQESKKNLLVKAYNDYYKKVNTNQTSGSLGRNANSQTTTRDLKSASKLENSLPLKSHFSRLKASVVDQVHSQLKTQYRDNLVQMRLLEGSPRIEDGQFICQLVSKGVGPVEFKVKLSPDSRFYNEKMSTVHDLQPESYFSNFFWSVIKSSAFVLLVIVTIQTTERDSELRDRRRREGVATRTARGDPAKDPKRQKGSKLIHVVIDAQPGSSVHVQIELFAPLHHFISTYCEEQNQTIESFRFYYQDLSINFSDTPSQLGMDDGDIIEVQQISMSG